MTTKQIANMQTENKAIMNELFEALTGDDNAERIGARFADMLKLKRDHVYKDHWVTSWGTKTNKGLARTIIAVLQREIEAS